MSDGKPVSTFPDIALKGSSGARGETRPGGCRPDVPLLRRPALDQHVIGDGRSLRLLVVELGRRAIVLAEPFRRVLLLIEARTAAAIGLGLLVGGLHAGHD